MDARSHQSDNDSKSTLSQHRFGFHLQGQAVNRLLDVNAIDGFTHFYRTADEFVVFNGAPDKDTRIHVHLHEVSSVADAKKIKQERASQSTTSKTLYVATTHAVSLQLAQANLKTFCIDPAAPCYQNMFNQLQTILNQQNVLPVPPLIAMIQNYTLDIKTTLTNDLLATCHRIALTPTLPWQEDLLVTLRAYAHKQANGNPDAYFATPKGSVVRQLIGLAEKACMFYEDENDAKNAYNALVQAIHEKKNVFGNIVDTVWDFFGGTVDVLHLKLNKLADKLSPIVVNNTELLV